MSLEANETSFGGFTPVWSSSDNPVVLSTTLEFRRNVEQCHEANSQQLRNLARLVYEQLRNLKESDGSQLTFAALETSYDALEALVARKMLPDEIMWEGLHETAVIHDKACRSVIGVNMQDQIVHFGTWPGLADDYALSVESCLVTMLDNAFGFERNDDGSFLTHNSDMKGEAVKVKVLMNVPATILCKYGMHMRRVAEVLKVELHNWFLGCPPAGLAVVSSTTHDGENGEKVLERVRRTVQLYETVELQCRQLFRANPGSLYSVVKGILERIGQVRQVSENRAMMWLSVLWLAHDIGMLPTFDMEQMKMRLLELTDLSLREYVERYSSLTDNVGVVRAHGLKALVNQCLKG